MGFLFELLNSMCVCAGFWRGRAYEIEGGEAGTDAQSVQGYDMEGMEEIPRQSS